MNQPKPLYEQYNAIEWKNQITTRLNEPVNMFIIEKYLTISDKDELRIFDIGFGVGFLFTMVTEKLSSVYNKIYLDGCEPASKSFQYFTEHTPRYENVEFGVVNSPFLTFDTNNAYDVITAVFVLPHIDIHDLVLVASKISTMLNAEGKCIIVIANELQWKQRVHQHEYELLDLEEVELFGRKYKQVLNKTSLPQIGVVTDYNRDEKLYIDMFENQGLILKARTDLEDQGFISTVLVFQR